MLTTRPYLTIFRPSSTTVSFTVSTNLRPLTLASHLSHWLLLTLRTALGLFAIFVLTAKYLQSTPAFSFALSKTVTTVPWMYIAPISVGTLVLAFRRFQTEESLLILRSLGIQTTSVSPYYLLPPTTRFIPTSQIRDIFIHEAFRGFEVRYYLAVVVEDEAEVVVVFPKLLPGRAIIEKVWRGARECLYEPKT